MSAYRLDTEWYSAICGRNAKLTSKYYFCVALVGEHARSDIVLIQGVCAYLKLPFSLTRMMYFLLRVLSVDNVSERLEPRANVVEWSNTYWVL